MAYLLDNSQRFVPTTGTTVTIIPFDGNEATIFLDPAGTIATLTIAMPTGVANGQIVRFATSQIVTALTMTTPTGTIIGALTTLALGGKGGYAWNSTSAKWFPI